MTNPDKREHQTRFPVFLPSKDFAQNQCKACVPVGRRKPLPQLTPDLRPLPLQLATGTVPVQNVSYVDLSLQADLSKQKTQMALDRIVLTLSEKARNVRRRSLTPLRTKTSRSNSQASARSRSATSSWRCSTKTTSQTT